MIENFNLLIKFVITQVHVKKLFNRIRNSV